MAQPSEALGNPATGNAPIPGSAIATGNAGNFLLFFGLRRNPFHVNPNPRELFWTPQTLRALSEITAGIEAGSSLIILSGEPGTGKTTLINHLLSSLRQRQAPVAFVFNSHLDVDNLFDFILADFGIHEGPSRPRNVRRTLHDWLYTRHRAGERPVLIVDEAQGLTEPALEEIRMLLNLEIEGEKLIQILLSGQPELDALLAKPQLLQLRQRVSLRCRTAELTLPETQDYIARRLEFGGVEPGSIFAPEALDAIYFYSGGTPRVINLLCEQSLMHAHREMVLPVPPRIVEAVAREFQFDDFKPFPRSVSFMPPTVADILPMSSSPSKMRMATMSARAAQPHAHVPQFQSMPAPTGVLRARELASVGSVAAPIEMQAPVAPPPRIALTAAAVPAAPAPAAPLAPVAPPIPEIQPVPKPLPAFVQEEFAAVKSPAHEIATAALPQPLALVAPHAATASTASAPKSPVRVVAASPIVPPLATRFANAVDPTWQKLQNLYTASARWLRQPMPVHHPRRK